MTGLSHFIFIALAGHHGEHSLTCHLEWQQLYANDIIPIRESVALAELWSSFSWRMPIFITPNRKNELIIRRKEKLKLRSDPLAPHRRLPKSAARRVHPFVFAGQ